MRGKCDRAVQRIRASARKTAPVLRRAAAWAARCCSRLRAALARAWRRPRHGRPGRHSLRLRLSLFFALFLALAWLFASFFAWKECREYIDEFFDTQQMLFAGRLSMADFSGGVRRLAPTKDLLRGVGKKARGELDDDALGFAVFTAGGQRVLTDGEKGGRFLFDPNARGFTTMRIAGDDDDWRILWLRSPDGKYVIAVGQEVEYRQDLALDMLKNQLTPWLVLLPVLLAELVLLLNRELAPLHAVAANLRARKPADASLLDETTIPLEVRPMVESLNGLFARTGAMIKRERAFTSDAAHELRTPLAGLRVQAEVAAQDGIDPETRAEALRNLCRGIDRSSRLVDQLLALSRLEAPGDAPITAGPALDWPAVLHAIIEENRPKAEQKKIQLRCEITSMPGAVPGDAGLAAMLARNLMDNAVTYTPQGGYILVRLEKNGLHVENSAIPLPGEYAARLGERFFRPPGQMEPGSGLGLSIARRIAEMHSFGLAIRLCEKDAPGEAQPFSVTVSW